MYDLRTHKDGYEIFNTETGVAVGTTTHAADAVHYVRLCNLEHKKHANRKMDTAGSVAA